MGKAFFHTLFKVEKTLVHAVEALVGKLIHMIKTFVYAPDELAELSRSNVLVSHVVAPPPCGKRTEDPMPQSDFAFLREQARVAIRPRNLIRHWQFVAIMP